MVKKHHQKMISELRNEYDRIDAKWLKLHYHTFVGFVLLGFIIECALVLHMYRIGDVSISFQRYVMKYLVAPCVGNVCLILIGKFVMWLHLNQRTKIYAISLLFVGVCFVLYSVHIIFDSLYVLFTIPILLTVIYNDYIITTVIAIISIVLKVLVHLFVRWDPDKVSPLTTGQGSVDFTVSICILLFFYAACMIVIYFEREKNFASIQKEIQYSHMEQKLVTDELTKIQNRTALREAVDYMKADKPENQYVFAMLDLDNFKTLNDTLGHHEGDKGLREFGRILRNICSGNIWAYRFGGDEFCLIFKNQELVKIKSICQNIQNKLEMSTVNRLGLGLTVSVGVAYYKKGMTMSELLKNTDLALYSAKKVKNKICVYEEMKLNR